MWHVMWLQCHMPSSLSKRKTKKKKKKSIWNQKNKRKEKEKWLVFQRPITRHGSYWGWKSVRWTWRCVDLWNNFGFSLYAMPFVYCIVTISENRKKSEIGVSADLVCCYWIPEIKFNKSLSLLIIRLANYSVTTSLIYKFLL